MEVLKSYNMNLLIFKKIINTLLKVLGWVIYFILIFWVIGLALILLIFCWKEILIATGIILVVIAVTGGVLYIYEWSNEEQDQEDE